MPCQELTENEKFLKKMDAKLRRLCQYKRGGRLDVPEWVYQEWRKGGGARKVLLKDLVEADGDKACTATVSIKHVL